MSLDERKTDRKKEEIRVSRGISRSIETQIRESIDYKKLFLEISLHQPKPRFSIVMRCDKLRFAMSWKLIIN